MSKLTYKSRYSGFTLLEVLITIVVLAIGLLGLAGLQAKSMRDNHSAYHRTQATQFSYDIIDRIRSNISAINSYKTSNPSTASAQTSCLSSGCSPTQMSQNDLHEWFSALSATLPMAQASISQAGDTYTVAIQWDDNRDGIVDGDDPNFQVGFIP